MTQQRRHLFSTTLFPIEKKSTCDSIALKTPADVKGPTSRKRNSNTVLNLLSETDKEAVL